MGQVKTKVSGIILAAGLSKRMEGEHKLLLPFGDKPLLQSVIDAAVESNLEQVIVVLPPEYDNIYSGIDFKDVQCVPCTQTSTGKFYSLQRGLAHLDDSFDGCMVIPADLPLLKSSSINFLLDSYHQDISSWTVPTQEEMRGKPFIIPQKDWSRLRQETTKLSTRDLFALPRIRLRLVKMIESDLFMDMNTQQDYQRITQRFFRVKES